MPKLPPRPCNHPRCTAYAVKGGRCEEHKIKAWDHKGKNRHDRGYGNDWDKLKKRVLAEDGNLCQPCLKDGVYTNAVDVDHIINKASGGTNQRANLQSICKACHRIKTKKESEHGRLDGFKHQKGK